VTAAPQICEGCDESRPTSLHLITRHNGTTVRARYCADCAELARMDWNGETKSIAPALTADTITDEMILALLNEAQYREWSHTASIAHVALHGVIVKQTRRSIRREKIGPVYRRCREQCADVLNQRPEILDDAHKEG
jgi:hypothetical protein